MQDIRGNAKNIRALLGEKYTIDYYQREYLWEKKQIMELIDDLSEKFNESHKEGNTRAAIKNYGRYFLGSIIISNKDDRKYIIDGQQRLTSLTLLLIYLINQLNDDDESQKHQKTELTRLIFSHRIDELSFNIDVAERKDCMEALLKGEGESFDETNQTESVINILHRYRDIEEYLPNELSDDALPYFADWLIENVYLVEITAYSDTDAYTIFETMNDRGLSLTPTDMLKGYLLSRITEPDNLRVQANIDWKCQIAKLQEIGKEEDADAIKAWLRSQYAQTQREREAGAQSQDFELIGTEFHRWVRSKEDFLQLSSSADFAKFIQVDFAFYAKWYEKLQKASRELMSKLEAVYFNAEHAFTLQYPMLLAPLKSKDSENEIIRKLEIVSNYVDIFINRRIWNGRSIGYSTVLYTMFLVIKEIRGLAAEELEKTLKERLSKDEHTFSSNSRFQLNRNRKKVHRILARLIHYIETQSQMPMRYTEYVARGANSYEIEHIWSNHHQRHLDEFADKRDFEEYRNRIGGLLLLPKKFNASYGDLPYEEKYKHYLKHDLLTQSLHEQAYEKNPGFKQFIEKSGLNFQPHPQFKKADLDARQLLYQQLAEQIWNPDNLLREARS